MTTVPSRPVAVIAGVDTHADIHVAAACDRLGKVLGTKSFVTTPAGYRDLLSFLAGFGQLQAVGVEGTGSYGSGLARHLAQEQVRVLEVSRPNRQVRRAHGKSDVIDAIAAALAVISDQATVIPKSHDGTVEGLRALQIVHRSAHKARTQTLNQLHALIVTAPEPIRGQLRGLGRAQMLTTCQSYRPGDRDDLASVIKLACVSSPPGSLTSTTRSSASRPVDTASSAPTPRNYWPSSASAPTPPRPCWSPPGTTPTG